MRSKKIKVICAMSGGVDSAVAAALLKQQGYDVIGVFMKFWNEPNIYPSRRNHPHAPSARGGFNKCCSIESYMAAKRVAQILDIPLYTINFQEAFKKKIVDNFLEEYEVGLTPNPCVRCNRFIKFGLLMEKMKEYGAEYVATGHYVRLRREITNSKLQIPNKFQNSKLKFPNSFQFPVSSFQAPIKLLKARDKNKDQSYFLYNLTQEKLRHILFPVGDYTKSQVRKLAEKFKLPLAQKAESQELCFINEKDHYGFLRRNLKLKKGDIFTVEGEKVGRHQGLPLYTIGQRRGIEIGGIGPYYVVELDFKKNRLIVANDSEHPALSRDYLICKDIHWISGVEPKLSISCKARVRYRQKESPARVVRPTPLGLPEPSVKVCYNNGVGYLVKFKKPQRAITAGQSVVLYCGEEVIGGGVITNF